MTAPEIPAEPTPLEIVAKAMLMVTQGDVDPEYAWRVQEDEVREELLAQATAAWPLIAAQVVEHEGDGYHTHAELYRYRMLYNAHAAKAWADQGIVVKSWRHSDGEECFGGGWFVVVANLHPFGQVSNHYEAEHWDLFDVPAVEMAPEWDGHTPEQAADRLEEALGARATAQTPQETP